MNARLVSWPTISVSIGSIKKPKRRGGTEETVTRVKRRSDGRLLTPEVSPQVLGQSDGRNRGGLGTQRSRTESGDEKSCPPRVAGFAIAEAALGARDDHCARDRTVGF